MYRYAQIDNEGYVVSDSWLSGEVDDKNMIPVLDGFDLSNKRYVNGAWKKYAPEPTAKEITSDEVQAQILLNQVQIIAKQQEQDEVLATILLDQVRGGEADV